MFRRASRRARIVALASLLVAGTVVTTAGAPSAAADGPGAGAPWVVSLGDSAISGEAGRWAGNTNNGSNLIDAGGANAYWDNAGRTAEAIPGCHRSESAAIHIGGGVSSLNLACSGAKTFTSGGGSSDFKPGIDFANTAYGKGQALSLQEFASTHNVKMVAVMIGANDFGFADILQACHVNWLTSPSWWKNYCYDDSGIKNRFTSTNIAAKTAAIKGAFLNVRQAMTNAGYSASQYTIVAHTYWSPVPSGAGNRYPESGWTRQSVGGCGTWNRDANWANDTVVNAMNSTMKNAIARSGLANTVVLDLQDSLVGRRLCENTVGLLEEVGLSSWQSPGAVDRTEWVAQIRTTSTILGPYQLQEDGHASYWGQLAMRNCLRQAYNGGTVRGGRCVRVANGLNAQGEPQMGL